MSEIENKRTPLGNALFRLTANLMRISAGGGNPERLAYQIADLIAEINEDCEGYASQLMEVAQALKSDSFLDYEGLRQFAIEEQQRLIAEHEIVRAALRVRASEMQGLLSQRSNAMHDLCRAIRDLNEARSRRAANAY